VFTVYWLDIITLNCGLCQIGVMTAYRLESIKFEMLCVSDCCDDCLQAGQYKVCSVVCVKLV